MHEIFTNSKGEQKWNCRGGFSHEEEKRKKSSAAVIKGNGGVVFRSAIQRRRDTFEGGLVPLDEKLQTPARRRQREGIKRRVKGRQVLLYIVRRPSPCGF